MNIEEDTVHPFSADTIARQHHQELHTHAEQRRRYRAAVSDPQARWRIRWSLRQAERAGSAIT